MKKASYSQVEVSDLLAMKESERIKFFSMPSNRLPPQKKRAELLMGLPVKKAARVVGKMSSMLRKAILIDHLLNRKNGETFVFEELLPEVSTNHMVQIAFEMPLMSVIYSFGDFFKRLPKETIVMVIDKGIWKTKDQRSNVCDILTYISYMRTREIEFVVEKVRLKSFSMLLDFDPSRKNPGLFEAPKVSLMNAVSLLDDNRRIAQLCQATTLERAMKIIKRIQITEKQNAVLSLLPSKYRVAFSS